MLGVWDILEDQFCHVIGVFIVTCYRTIILVIQSYFLISRTGAPPPLLTCTQVVNVGTSELLTSNLLIALKALSKLIASFQVDWSL
jgi:hypothetical protein